MAWRMDRWMDVLYVFDSLKITDFIGCLLALIKHIFCMTKFYIHNPTKYLNLTTTLLTEHYFRGQSWTNCNPKVVALSLRSGKYCRWGEWMSSALSTLNTTTEVRWDTWTRHWTPACGSINGYPLLRVCVHGVCVFVHYSLLCVFTWMG